MMHEGRRLESEAFTPAMMTRAWQLAPDVASYIEGRRRRGVHTLGLSFIEARVLMTRGLSHDG